MPNVNDLSVDDELSRSDAEDLTQDIHRILRRARYDIRQRNTIKESRQFVRSAARNLRELFNQILGYPDELEFEECWNVVQRNHDAAVQAANPFISYFYSHGLLPDSVTEDALIVYAMIQGKKLLESSPS